MITKPTLPPKAGYVEVEYNGERRYKDVTTGKILGEPPALEEAKTTAITASKTALADYLLAHPLQWTDGEYYAITAEKQAQLTSKIMAATLAAQTSTPYTLTWNSTGEVCKEWTLSDLSALAFVIDARVTALVTYQQQREVEIRNCETVEAVNAVVVDYDTVQ